MKRRQFIRSGLVSGLAFGAGGLLWLRSEGKEIDLSIATAVALLDGLAGKPVVGSGLWKPYKIFSHCAQSVEYSMTQYPVHKSEFFKETLGKIAFSAFKNAGKMKHGLNEAIPGAEDIAGDGDTNQALTRLKKAYLEFQAYKGTLAPHFAYGDLTRPEYAKAHVMHLYNHLNEVSWN